MCLFCISNFVKLKQEEEEEEQEEIEEFPDVDVDLAVILGWGKSKIHQQPI